MKSRIRTGILSAAGILVLVLDGKTALQGALEGISLCIRAVIPSLFPFFVLSVLLTSSISGMNVSAFRPLGRLMGIPAGSEGIFITGLLGGYPSGAQAVSQCLKSRLLTETDAKRMLGFCSNAGPALFFGILAPQFTESKAVWFLWGIHIFSAIAVGTLLPGKSSSQCKPEVQKPLSVSSAIERAIKIMATVCSWIILFRVFLLFSRRWFLWLLPLDAQICIEGILELTNGCCSLHFIENEGLRFVICSGMVAFGGICVAMQTASVAGSLMPGWYLPGKVLQCLISLLVAVFTQMLFFSESDSWAAPPLLTGLLIFLVAALSLMLQKKQNKGSIPAAIGV